MTELRDEFYLPDLVARLRPGLMVELGTGDGSTAARVMAVLPAEGRLVTINWPNPPSGDNPERYLAPWLADPRLRLIRGDTREQAHLFEDGAIDILFIDSTHTNECARTEWDLYRPRMKPGAWVAVDDLDHGDMMAFWDRLPYPRRVVLRDGTLGVFRYDP